MGLRGSTVHFQYVEDNGLELGRVLRRRVKIGLRLAGSHYNNSEPAVSFMAWFCSLCHRAKPRLTYLSLQTNFSYPFSYSLSVYVNLIYPLYSTATPTETWLKNKAVTVVHILSNIRCFANFHLWKPSDLPTVYQPGH